MKIAMFSDLHGKARLPRIEKGTDVVCIAGDSVPMDVQRDASGTYRWIVYKFFRWVKRLDVHRVIFIAGNHDVYLDQKKHPIRELIAKHALQDKLIYLEDSEYEYGGLKFYGTPWVTGLSRWAYNTYDPALVFGKIPDCDVLISHSAPNYGDAGTSFPGKEWAENWGSDELASALMRRDIRVCICGHIHTGIHGGIRMERYDGSECIIYNVSMVNEEYSPYQMVKYIELEPRGNDQSDTKS